MDQIESGTFRMFSIQDDAMDIDARRAIEKGDDVIGLLIDREFWEIEVAPSEETEWVVIVDDQPIVRHITKRENGVLTLTGNNEDKDVYADLLIPLTDISEIYRVVEVHKYR